MARRTSRISSTGREGESTVEYVVHFKTQMALRATRDAINGAGADEAIVAEMHNATQRLER